MKKKIFAPALFVVSLLLTSCGQSGGLNGDGRLHRLDDDGMIITEGNFIYYNETRSGGGLFEDQKGEETWLSFEETTTIEYQRIKNTSKNLYRISFTKETISDNVYYEEKSDKKGLNTYDYEETIVRGEEKLEYYEDYEVIKEYRVEDFRSTEEKYDEIHFYLEGAIYPDKAVVSNGNTYFKIEEIYFYETVAKEAHSGGLMKYVWETYRYEFKSDLKLYSFYPFDLYTSDLYCMDKDGFFDQVEIREHNNFYPEEYAEDKEEYLNLDSKVLAYEEISTRPRAVDVF